MKKLFLVFSLTILLFFSSSFPAFSQSNDCTLYPTSQGCSSLDNDGDGQPNSSDPYPNDSSNNDSDSDGVPNNLDSQPNDPTNDSDSDGVPNNQDSLPSNSSNDSDGDGVPNNQDAFPLDPTKGGSSSSPSPSTSPSSSPSSSPSPSPSPSSSPSPTPSSSNTGIFDWLGSIWSSLSGFLKSFWDSLSKIFSIFLGAIANPFGAVNSFICLLIDGIALVWPSTPQSLKIGSLIASIGTAIPLIGTAVVYDIFSTAASMLAIVLLIKLYKLIPFKMS